MEEMSIVGKRFSFLIIEGALFNFCATIGEDFSALITLRSHIWIEFSGR